MTKRNIFGELMEGVAAMKSHREGKLTLRSFKVEPAPLPKTHSGDAPEIGLLTRRVRTPTPHQLENP
jgi:hypothetical protein